MNTKIKRLFSKQKLSASIALSIAATAMTITMSQKKAVAGSPSAYTYAVNLSIDHNQCMEKASQAANLVLPELQEPIVHEHGITLFGNTQATSTTITCIDRSLGSTLTVVSSGDSWNDGTANEAKSIRDRMMQVLSSSL